MTEKARRLVIALEDYGNCPESLVGGKGAKLSALLRAGFRAPPGFCVTVDAYRLYLEHNQLARRIKMELGRKPLKGARWEELWDAALRIRSAFLTGGVPGRLADALGAAHRRIPSDASLVVRSSALGEDSGEQSFAGIHESVVGVRGFDAMLEAMRVVWASLWSDAALLYRAETNLDPDRSAMAVVVQTMIGGGPSGVAFGRDPRNREMDHAVVEAVPGQNSELVDGLVDPDRWILARGSGDVVESRRGERQPLDKAGPLLATADLRLLLDRVLKVEKLFGWPADMEWTGRGDRLTLLQARPITSGGKSDDDADRSWYLSLRPKHQQLKELAEKVDGGLIPELTELGERLAAEPVENLSDRDLASAVQERLALVRRWRQIYIDDFIPLAHGVRQLGVYYNNAVRPDDPYEFLRLLEGEDMLAVKRNRLLSELARSVAEDNGLNEVLREFVSSAEAAEPAAWKSARSRLLGRTVGIAFIEKLEQLLNEFTDISYGGDRLSRHPEVYVHTILELAQTGSAKDSVPAAEEGERATRHDLEQRLLGAVGADQADYAREMIALGRLSWRLRDDDNMLVGRLESQLLRAVQTAAARLVERGLLAEYERLSDQVSLVLADALLSPPDQPIELPEPASTDRGVLQDREGTPRQLVGQPAGPGIATGTACIVNGTADLVRIQRGQVLVCDAIQPSMTHVVPLVAAIVERRGGMLIHGAIVARELKIPCVNGVADAVKLIENGELVTVDGHLGIVTVGPPELLMEAAVAGATPSEPGGSSHR